jgi:hypothetical protein
MSAIDISSYSLWFLGAGLEAIAVAVMMRRRLVQEFPVFFSYLAFHVVYAFLGFFVRIHYGGDNHVNIVFYWTGQAIGTGLRFAVIYEIFVRVLRPYSALQQGGAILLKWTTLLLLFVAVMAALSHGNGDPSWAIKGAVSLNRSVNVVQCGLLVFLFLYSSYFGLTWRHYVFGIALGFGLIASLELLSATLRAQIGASADLLFDFVPRISFVVAIFIWNFYLLTRPAVRLTPHTLPNNNLEEWNRQLSQLLQR